MAAFDPRDRGEVDAAKGWAGYGGDRAAGLGHDNRFDSRLQNSRYQPSRGVARPATLGNIGTALGMFGPGLAIKGPAMIGGWDPYSGPQAPHTNFSYDGPNRFAQGQGGPQMGGQMPFMPPQQRQMFMPPPQRPQQPMGYQPGMQMNSPLQGYGAFRPGYNFINGPFR